MPELINISKKCNLPTMYLIKEFNNLKTKMGIYL